MITIIFDTETTGLLLPSTVPLNQQPHIIEIGAIKVEGDKVIGELSQLIKPPIPISEKITKITGITNDDVEGKPTFKECFPEILRFFTCSDMLVAHNVVFDVGMLKTELRRIGGEISFPFPESMICTVQEYHYMFGQRPSLRRLYEKMMDKPLVQTHRALDDANALKEILTVDGFFDKIGK